jgi:hypothetical protein
MLCRAAGAPSGPRGSRLGWEGVGGEEEGGFVIGVARVWGLQRGAGHAVHRARRLLRAPPARAPPALRAARAPRLAWRRGSPTALYKASPSRTRLVRGLSRGRYRGRRPLARSSGGKGRAEASGKRQAHETQPCQLGSGCGGGGGCPAPGPPAGAGPRAIPSSFALRAASAPRRASAAPAAASAAWCGPPAGRCPSAARRHPRESAAQSHSSGGATCGGW